MRMLHVHPGARVAALLLISLAAASGTASWGQQPPATVPPQDEPAAPQDPFGTRPRLDVTLHVGADRSDNVKRTETGQQGDTLASVGVGMDVLRNGPRLSYNAFGMLEHVEYLDDSYDSRQFGSFNAGAIVGGEDSDFKWTAQDTYGQLQSDPFQPATAANLDSVNYFSTGPIYNIELNSSTRLSLVGLYSSASYDKSDLDLTTLLGGATIERVLANSRKLSLVTAFQSVDFENETIANRNYNFQQALVRYDFGSSRVQGSADLGYVSIKQKGLPSDGSIVMALELRRVLSSSSTAYVRANKGVTSAVDALRAGIGAGFGNIVGGAGGISSGLSTGTAFTAREIGAGWRWHRARTEFQLEAYRNSEDYKDVPLFDRRVTGGAAEYRRRMRPTVTFLLEARYDREHFPAIDRNIDEWNAKAAISKQLGRKFFLDVHYQRFHRSGDSGVGGEFRESRYGVWLQYQLLNERD